MTQTHLLSVEIKTLEPSLIDLDVHSSLVIFCDPRGNHFLAKGLDDITTAIIDSIPHLGTNFRYPLLFQIEIISGPRRRISKQNQPSN